MDKKARREAIRQLLLDGSVGSQAELVRSLKKRGIVVNQSTVSRDLREMGAIRIPGGGYVLPVEGMSPPASPGELRRGLREFLRRAEASGNLVVLKTGPGNAQALAAILDRAGLDEVVGTVAGDDTVLVVVKEGRDAGKLARRFQELSFA